MAEQTFSINGYTIYGYTVPFPDYVKKSLVSFAKDEKWKQIFECILDCIPPDKKEACAKKNDMNIIKTLRKNKDLPLPVLKILTCKDICKTFKYPQKTLMISKTLSDKLHEVFGDNGYVTLDIIEIIAEIILRDLFTWKDVLESQKMFDRSFAKGKRMLISRAKAGTLPPMQTKPAWDDIPFTWSE